MPRVSESETKKSECLRENEDLAMVTRGERKRGRERNRGQKGAKGKEKEREKVGVFGQGWNFRAGTSLKIHAARNAGRELELLRLSFVDEATRTNERTDGMYYMYLRNFRKPHRGKERRLLVLSGRISTSVATFITEGQMKLSKTLDL